MANLFQRGLNRKTGDAEKKLCLAQQILIISKSKVLHVFQM
jgi:hypothetical protein